MGFVRTQESKKAELNEFLRLLRLKCAGVYTVEGAKGEEEANRNVSEKQRIFSNEGEGEVEEEEDGERWVCVTSGVSFLGLTIVNRLLDRGYSVRIAVENQDDLESFGLMEESRFGGGGGGDGSGGGMRRRRICAVRATVTEVESLCEAFGGCRGVFHTSAFADPAGVSGYSKFMAELEVKACENVMEACARTPSVTKCVFTSSLLACIWRNNNDNILQDPPLVFDHNSWSEESVCREKKLWYALGKTMAEKTAWRVARENKIKLVTVCPGLITGPQCLLRNPTPSIAYLKGAQEMYAEGLLAIADIHKVAEAHVCIYETMGNTASGRYICFDHIIDSEEKAVNLARKMGISEDRISASNSPISEGSSSRYKLCNEKLSRLMSRRSRCSTKMYA